MPVFDPYLRKSTVDDRRSVTRQERDITEDLAAEGIEVGQTFVDPDLSASVFARKPRPGYNELVEHIRAGHCEGIAMWEASRGSRDAAEWLGFLELCKKRGTLIRIQSHRRTYDARRRRDWRTLADEGLDAHDESLRLSDRVQDGKKDAAYLGRPPGNLVFGYLRIYSAGTGKYEKQVEHPINAPVAREVFKRVAAREPVSSICRDLNQREEVLPAGVAGPPRSWTPGPHGSPWRTFTVRQLVRNPAYIAQRLHQGKVFGPAAWPALIDEETWLAANAVLSEPGRRTARGTALAYFTSGAIRCGRPDCPGVLVSRGVNGNGKRRYACRVCRRNSISAEPLERFVESMLRDRLRQKDALSALNETGDTDELRAAKREETDLDDALKGHYAQAAALNLTPEGLAAVEAGIMPRLRAVREKVRRLSTPPKLRHLAGVDLAAAWPDLPVTTQRDVLLLAADLVVDPQGAPSRALDRWRLARSRWRGDSTAWGDHWRAAGLSD